ncbi:MAG TPA: alcohol dehydrogenase catalytic domain-containing protein [Dehalococcoidia bacterium]|nr:alcohol dehydrogenase catalytic domain-containing protein [Dehalococcoidia bacterium]
MKAAVLHETGGPEAFRLEDVPVPPPGPTQVLIKVAACGMCGHDQADRSGLTNVEMPVILGHEVSGTVVDLGPKASHFQAGDRVACKQFTTCGWCRACQSGRDVECDQRSFNYGGFAEFVAIEERALLPVPDEVDLAEASVVACALGSCVHALRQIARLAFGETVLVTGAGGGLGLHGLQFARSLGARTIALTTSPDKVEKLQQCGADAVVLAGGDAYWQNILAANAGNPVDVVLDNVGHPAVFTPCFWALARGGRYVFTGQVERRKVEFYPAFVLGKEAIITGSGSTRSFEFMDAMESVRTGSVRPVIERFPLDSVVEAWRRMDARQVFGRAVLVP